MNNPLEKLFEKAESSFEEIAAEIREKRKNPSADISIKVQQDVERILKMEEPGWVNNASQFDLNKEESNNVYLRVLNSKTEVTASALLSLVEVFESEDILLEANTCDAGGPYITLIVLNPSFR